MSIKRTLALLPQEREVVETVLWFANLKRIRSTEQIENRFMKLSIVPGVFKVIRMGEEQAYRSDQEELKHWLADIAASAGGRKKIGEEVNQMLARTINAQVSFVNGRLIYFYAITGVQAACAFGTALILDESRGLTSRLKRCGNKYCERFNLEFEPGGRPRRFCNSECKRLHDNQTAAVRQARSRARRKSQGGRI